MVDVVKEEPNERCTSRSGCEMIESTKQSPHSISELVVYHKVKRIFINLKDLEKENPDELQIFEFNGQNFELIAD
jgi:hypothetical protein